MQGYHEFLLSLVCHVAFQSDGRLVSHLAKCTWRQQRTSTGVPEQVTSRILRIGLERDANYGVVSDLKVIRVILYCCMKSKFPIPLERHGNKVLLACDQLRALLRIVR